MNQQEIQAMCEWDAYDMGRLRLHVPLLEREMTFVLFPLDRAPPVVTEKMAAIVGDVLALPAADLKTIKELLWEEADFAFRVADYGCEPQDGESDYDANVREFGISNPEQAYARSRISEIHVHDDHKARFAEIFVETGTSNSIVIVVKDGRIVDWDDDGAYLPRFEENEKAARDRRSETLARTGNA